MKNLNTRRSTKTYLAATLLLMLFAFTLPYPAAATTYTYTGNPFTTTIPGSVWPATPAIGSNLTMSFTYTGDLSAVLNTELVGTAGLTDFTMTTGQVTKTLASPSQQIQLVVFALDASGLPDGWYMNNAQSSTTRPDFYLYSFAHYGNNQSSDGVQYYPASGGIPGYQGLGAWSFNYTMNGTHGVWSTSATPPTPEVPLPPSAFLLGSGLLGLVGFRRLRKS